MTNPAFVLLVVGMVIGCCAMLMADIQWREKKNRINDEKTMRKYRDFFNQNK